MRYQIHSETRNHSTDEQLDGESFRLSGRPSGPSGPTASSPLTRVPEDRLDSDGEVDMVVRKASSQHPGIAVEFSRTDSSQSLSQNGPTTLQVLIHDRGRARSKTISSIPQSPSSFAKLAQDKLFRMESDSSSTITGRPLSPTPGSHRDITNLTPSSSTTSREPLHNPSTSQPSSDPTPENLTTKTVPNPPGRIKSAPARREEPPEQGTRPNAGRSRSDTAIGSSPIKAQPDKANDVRKRIEELEAKMRGGAKQF